jgi:hypothetical protein
MEHVTNPITWWHKHRKSFPCLSHMAIDYLTIPSMWHYFLIPCKLTLAIATSVDVECLFSHRCLILSHIRNHLSVQSTHTVKVIVIFCIQTPIDKTLRPLGMDTKPSPSLSAPPPLVFPCLPTPI